MKNEREEKEIEGKESDEVMGWDGCVTRPSWVMYVPNQTDELK